MQTAEQLMTQAGLRPTKARIAVLNTLIASPVALNHTDILSALTSEKEFDRVTVYRVLDWLQENALIHKISSDDRAWKYQLNIPHIKYKNVGSSQQSKLAQSHSHAHLQCQQCGTVLCIHELAAHIPQAIFNTYQVSQIEINLKGICLNCQANPK